MRNLEDNALLLLVVVVSLAFAWIVWPFYEAVLWATVLAIVFSPLYRRLSSVMGQQHSLAALATVLIILTLVILPLTLIAASLVQEATNLYDRIQSGELDFGRFFQEFLNALPTWATDLLNRFGLTNFSALHDRLSAALIQGSKYLCSPNSPSSPAPCLRATSSWLPCKERSEASSSGSWGSTPQCYGAC
jgi:predicted PurR-regulated permease PerM